MLRRNFLVSVLLTALVACGGDGGDDSRPNSNADLASLVLEAALIAPAFASNITSYTADVTGGTTSTRVTARTADNRSRLTVNGNAATSGIASDPIDLDIGDTIIDVEVTAQDGTRKNYRVTVTRPVPGNDATLSRLELSISELVPIFDSAFFLYAATTGYLGTSTRVLAETSDPLADSINLNGVDIEDGAPSYYVELGVGGDTTLSVQVTAENDFTMFDYEVIVGRAAFNTLAQRAYVKATDPGPDLFGFGIALSGDTLLVGAPFEQSDAIGIDGDDSNDNFNDAGAAYAYDRIGGVWTVSNYLKASNTDPGDLFGWSAAASSDAIAIGAPGEQSLTGLQSDNSASNVGAVYAFDTSVLANPVQTDYLKASNADEDDAFGAALSMDVDQILIGARFEASNATGVDGVQNDNSLANAGAAYLFEKGGAGDWSQTAYIKASNTGADDQFGNALAVSGDSLAIGAWLEDSGSTGINGDEDNTVLADSGAVYLFDRAATGIWAQSAYIKASNTDPDDRFGNALDLDGDLLAVGAPLEDSDGTSQQNDAEVDSGAVYVFRRDGSGNWAQDAYLKASNPGLSDQFGASIALVGNLLAVGAPGERSNAMGINGNQINESTPDAGAVYLFERDATGTWSQIAYLKASNTDAGDRFGRNLALDRDTLAVGAPEEQSNASNIDGDQDNDTLNSAGAVYVFQ